MTSAERIRMKPILFNTDIVRAILDNRKTVTRRVVKPQPERDEFIYRHQECGEWFISPDNDCLSEIKVSQPYRPGDILYVQETWQHLYMPDRVYIYKADSDGREYLATNWKGEWRQSIYMPKKATRIFLRVTDVRVERLQNITEEEAVKEGFEAIPCDHPCGYPCADCMNTEYLEPAMLGFVETWNSTLKPADRTLYGWNANPWVWVIEFERLSQEATETAEAAP